MYCEIHCGAHTIWVRVTQIKAETASNRASHIYGICAILLMNCVIIAKLLQIEMMTNRNATNTRGHCTARFLLIIIMSGFLAHTSNLCNRMWFWNDYLILIEMNVRQLMGRHVDNVLLCYTNWAICKENPLRRRKKTSLHLTTVS